MQIVNLYCLAEDAPIDTFSKLSWDVLKGSVHAIWFISSWRASLNNASNELSSLLDEVSVDDDDYEDDYEDDYDVIYYSVYDYI